MTNKLLRRTIVIPLLLLVMQDSATLGQDKDPKPEPAVPAILAAFETYQVVAMNVGHGRRDVDDLILALVRNTSFPLVVDDIVLEGLNSLFQSTLDRYVAGGDVSVTEVQRVWRATSNPWQGIHDELVPLVRAINQTLPAAERLRVVAGEPPVDWMSIQSQADISRYYTARDSNLAAVMEKEVLAPGRKALLLYGTGHLARGFRDMALTLYERSYPGKTLVIQDHGCRHAATATTHEEIERRMRDWPVPSLALVRDTWIAELWDPAVAATSIIRGLPRWSDTFDAYLYLGPADRLLYKPTPAHIFADAALMTELRRREGFGFKYDILDPAKMGARGSNPLFCAGR